MGRRRSTQSNWKRHCCTSHQLQAPEVLVCPEKCRPEDNKTKASLVYGRTIDAWGMVTC